MVWPQPDWFGEGGRKRVVNGKRGWRRRERGGKKEEKWGEGQLLPDGGTLHGGEWWEGKTFSSGGGGSHHKSSSRQQRNVSFVSQVFSYYSYYRLIVPAISLLHSFSETFSTIINYCMYTKYNTTQHNAVKFCKIQAMNNWHTIYSHTNNYDNNVHIRGTYYIER